MPSAEKLLEIMRRKRDGYGPKDFEKLYTAFGFEKEEGGNHTLYRHPRYTTLRATVGRHPVLTPGYAVNAVKLIDQLTKLKAQEREEQP